MMKNYQFLNKIDISEQKSFLTQHHLEGYAFLFEKESVQEGLIPQLENKFNYQKLIHSIYLSEKIFLQKKCMTDEAQFIKGGALLDDVYKEIPGVRFIRDLDIYCHKNSEYDLLKAKLIENGYTSIKENKWKGSRRKENLVKKINADVSIFVELHNRLFYRQKDSEAFNLNLESHLLYIIIHYGYQHTFEKLYWLLDVIFYIEKYNAILDWDLFFQQARSHNMLRYVDSVLFLIHKEFGMQFNFDFESKLTTKLIPNFDFFQNYKSNYLRFLFYKNYLKNSPIENLDYSLHWFFSRFSIPKLQHKD